MRVRGSGFTLIELLVTIAVIAVLLGVILPALPMVWASAEKVGCRSNLRQIGGVIEIHKGRNNQRYPVARYAPEPWLSGSDDPALSEALSSELEPTSEAWRCPGDDVVAPFEYEDEDGDVREAGVSYSYSSFLSGRRFEETFFYQRLMRQAAETPVLQDFDGGTFETESGETVLAGFFHDNRQFLFVDGHVGELGEREEG